jgi:deoxyribonuclease-4
MKIGAHVSAAGGIFKAPGNAAELGCEVFQVFSRSPQGGPAPKLTVDVIQQFRTEMKTHNFSEWVIHGPYYINFSSTNPRIYNGSSAIIREELERGSLLGAQSVITHLGSAKDSGPKLGFEKTWKAIDKILTGYKGTTQLLMEITAGAGDLMGDTFEELAAILKAVEKKAANKNKVHICLDTCHVFADGYDLRTPAAVNATVKLFDKIVGLNRLKFFHLNDSKAGLGEHKDRHEHIGKGKIGQAGFKALVNHPKLKGINGVIETPWDDLYIKDLQLLKKLRT